MSKLIKYYLLVSFFYILEIYIFWIFQKVVLNDILLIFFIRIFFVVILAQFLRKSIFNKIQSFYFIFYSVALLNPLISSMFIYLILNFMSENVTFANLLQMFLHQPYLSAFYMLRMKRVSLFLLYF